MTHANLTGKLASAKVVNVPGVGNTQNVFLKAIERAANARKKLSEAREKERSEWATGIAVHYRVNKDVQRFERNNKAPESPFFANLKEETAENSMRTLKNAAANIYDDAKKERKNVEGAREQVMRSVVHYLPMTDKPSNDRMTCVYHIY
ncbi:MAG: hypothetical protein NT051_06055 [Candidatus Micrarchaeota archaeon]|nr:hypothetical protein [Candidatus Micrarchaeota archaeon]